MTEFAHGDDDAGGVGTLTADITERDGVVIVNIAGELDMATVRTVDPLLDDAVGRGRPVVVDMTGLTFFSSTGLTVLARLDEHRRLAALDLRLVADQRAVILPLQLTGLEHLFPVHATMDDALASIHDGGRSG